MFFIDDTQHHIQETKEEHIEKLLPKVIRWRDNLANVELRALFDEPFIRKLLSEKPEQLLQLNLNFYDNYSSTSGAEFLRYKTLKYRKAPYLPEESEIIDLYDGLRAEIEQIVKYTGGFSRKRESVYNAYKLAANLNINTCAYCNRIYTKTVLKPKKTTRPQFDHWFPKSIYPLLGLSFYNLIPSCNICNSSIKGTVDFQLDTHLHPYVDKDINFQFSYYNKSLNSYGFDVNFANDADGRTESTVKAFKLKDIYQTHEEEIKDLVQVRDVYSKAYLNNLRTLFKGLTISDKEIYRLAFNTHMEEGKFHERPLSKMKKDILTELGII